MLNKGYVQIYTGNGKGKTTAALGLALRAAGAGLKVLILQFMKGKYYSEHDAIKRFDDIITVEQYGSKKFCRPDNSSYSEHKEYIEKGYVRAKEALADDIHAVIILDEIITAASFNLITIEEIIALIKMKPKNKELILTGRYATEELIDHADLVTEMKEIKHYYKNGVPARKGIES